MLPHQGYYVAGPSVWWGYGSSGVPYPTMPEGSQWMHTTKEHVLNDQQKGNQAIQPKKRKYIKRTPSKQSNPHNQQNGNQLMHPKKVTYIQTTPTMEQQKGNQLVQQNHIKYMQTMPIKDYNPNDPKRGNVRYIHTMPAKQYTPTDQKKSNQMMLPKQQVQSMQIMPPREGAANDKGNQLMQNHIRLMQTLLPKDQKKSTGTKEDNPNNQQKVQQKIQLETMGPKELPSKDKRNVNELMERPAAPLQENAPSETQKENQLAQQNRKRSLETTASNGNSGFSIEFPHQMPVFQEARREKRATYARNWYARLSEERKSESRRKKALYAREYRAKRLGLFPDGEEGTFAEQLSGVDGMTSTPGMGNTEIFRSDEEDRNVIDGKSNRNRDANVALSLENVRARYCQRCFTEILEEQSQGYQTWFSMQHQLTMINHEGNTMENRTGKRNCAETPEQFFACNAVVDGRQSMRNQDASAEIAKNNERKKKKARTMHLVEIAKQNARAKACQKETELARIKAESCITKTEPCITKTEASITKMEAKTEACITKTEACITKMQDKCVKKTQDKCIKKTQDKCVTKTYTTKSEIDAGLALMLLSEASSRHFDD